MSLNLCIDQSTSATKALLFTESGALLDSVALPHAQIYPQPGWVEHDAEEIYRNTLAAVRMLVARNPEAVEALGLSITNQRETFVIFDRASGRPLHNAVVWQCVRGEPVCRAMIEAGHEARVHALTGLKIDTYFPAAKLRRLLSEEPALRAALASGDALFGTIDTYLIYRLTQGAVYATDHTNASRTLLYDIHTLAWSDELFATFAIDAAQRPAILESAAHFGETDLEGLLAAPLPICGVMGDSQAALFAQRCTEPGSAKITFGTGSSVLMTIGATPVLSDSGIVTAVAWVADGTPTYAFEGITNFTGATMAWLRDQLGLIERVEESEALARSVADNGGVYLVPAFVGLSAPYWRPDCRALITGLTPSSTRAHVVRAALESIAFVVRDVLVHMESDAGVALQAIRADGGAVRNRFLMQSVADILQCSVLAARLPELSAWGAALNGFIGAGVLTAGDLASLDMAVDRYDPVLAPAAVAQLRAGWTHAVAQALV